MLFQDMRLWRSLNGAWPSSLTRAHSCTTPKSVAGNWSNGRHLRQTVAISTLERAKASQTGDCPFGPHNGQGL